MKLYLKLNLYLLSVLLSPFVLAQDGIISGELYDQNEETVPFATVSVIKLPDSTLVTGTTSDIDGKFTVNPKTSGELILKFSAIGYTETFSPPFLISGNDFSKNFGSITLKEETTMLNEVMLKTWKPRIKVENGNMTMQVEGTTLAPGNTAYQMLTRAPGVSADQNGNLQLNGRSGISVMIDGRLTYLNQEDLKNLLESMPAEKIKNIEVLNNPPSKYDAEGNAGMLNINLKTNNFSGFSGSVYGGYTRGAQDLFNSGLSLNRNKGKWHSYMILDVSERGLVRNAEITRFYPEGSDIYEYRQFGNQTNKSLRPSLNVGIDYDINDRHTIGAMAQANYIDKDSEWLTRNQLFEAPQEKFADIDAANYSRDEIFNGRFNLHYTMNLDTIGSSLTAEADYAVLNKNIYSQFYNDYFYASGQTGEETLFSDSYSNYDIYAAKLDLQLPMKNGSRFETGIKTSKVISTSDLDFFAEENNDQVLLPENSDSFKYEEEIYAAYATYSTSFNNTWSLNAGLRLEQTYGLGISQLTGEQERNYLEWFPNVQLEQNVSENYKLTYSYNRRIQRPAYDRLNPFIFYLDPYNFVTGNPELMPQFSNSYSLNQSFFRKYNLLLDYELIKDYNTEIFYTDPQTGITEITAGNIDSFKSYMASLVAPVEITSFWNSNNTLVANYQDNRILMDENEVRNDALFYMLQSNHQLNLPADIKLELNATVRGPVAVGIYYIQDQWWLDAGIKKSFMGDKLDVSLRFTDVFRTQDMEISSQIRGNDFFLDQYFNQQAVSFNVRYNFSKGDSKKNTRSTNTLEEMSRAGGK